ncbi:hypothetical protein [Terasakiella sp. SH-1]|uniref:hypothetical protein n=1 Tax=Terasakiella sp. SH-1 TaxID=2560057 RepID=UPI001073B40E|nr:hypothetical protein [Terasakiella sp. SH-1]
MTIPTHSTHDYLRNLLSDLVKINGKPDFTRYDSPQTLDHHFDHFCRLLISAEEDLSIILALMDKDPECKDRRVNHRLQALVDYVEIACSIYESGYNVHPNTTLH